MEVSVQDFLDAAEKRLTPDRYQEIMGELWLRWSHVQRRLARGCLLEKAVIEEIQRACVYLKSPDNRRHQHRVRQYDPDVIDSFSDADARGLW
jgi:hypothetical protein